MAVNHRDRIANIRFAVMLVVFAAGTVTVGLLSGWLEAPAAGWLLAATVYDVWVWRTIAPMTPEQTQEHASAQDETRETRDAMLLAVNVLALVAVATAMYAAAHAQGVARILIAVLALATVGASWLLLHTIFTLRYTAQYYENSPPGGIGFNQDELARYLDIAYMAFSVGMTYQVSDNNISVTDIRDTVLRHSIFAYVFGTGIMATTINLAVTLTSG